MAETLERGGLGPEAVAAFDSLPPHGLGWLSVAMGSAVEQGLDPTEGGELLAKRLKRWVAEAPADSETMDAFATLAQGAVAHIARLPKLRARLAADAAFMEKLVEREDESHGITWIRELLERMGGELVVVHGESRRAVRLRFENVAKCFHLFSLIQSTLGRAFPGGQLPDEAVAKTARGLSEEPVRDRAWWHYQTHGSTPSMRHAVWGEETVKSLQREDGTYALVLWSPLLGDRAWNSGFFGPAIEAAPSDMRFLEEYQGEEAAAWCDRFLTPTT